MANDGLVPMASVLRRPCRCARALCALAWRYSEFLDSGHTLPYTHATRLERGERIPVDARIARETEVHHLRHLLEGREVIRPSRQIAARCDGRLAVRAARLLREDVSHPMTAALPALKLPSVTARDAKSDSTWLLPQKAPRAGTVAAARTHIEMTSRRRYAGKLTKSGGLWLTGVTGY